MNRKFEMDYGSQQLTHYADRLRELNRRVGEAHIKPLTHSETMAASRTLGEAIAEMRLVAQDLSEWSKTEKTKKKWQFWK